jgi:hypothetical protein
MGYYVTFLKKNFLKKVRLFNFKMRFNLTILYNIRRRCGVGPAVFGRFRRCFIGVEPRPGKTHHVSSLALVKRLIVGAQQLQNSKTSALGIRLRPSTLEVSLLDSMTPPRNGGMAVTLPALRVLCPPTLLICPHSSPISLATITSHRPQHPPPTPLHPSLSTTTVLSRPLPTKAERPRRPHGPETARAR